MNTQANPGPSHRDLIDDFMACIDCMVHIRCLTAGKRMTQDQIRTHNEARREATRLLERMLCPFESPTIEAPIPEALRCQQCDGTGLVTLPESERRSPIVDPVKFCPRCSGTGHIAGTPF